MTNMKRRCILNLILSASLLLGLAAPSLARAGAEDAACWIPSCEFTSLVANPSSLFAKAATEDNYSAKSVAAHRAWAVENLPAEIRDNRITDAAALDGLRQKLRPLFDRFPVAAHLELVLYRDRVGESYAPYVALGEKTLLVISESAVEFFPAEELRGAVAHELGHLFNFDAYADAIAAKDANKVRFYELQADAIGALLLYVAGEDPGQLLRAVKRHREFLEKHGLLDQTLVNLHPTLAEREAVSQLVLKRLPERPLARQALNVN
jgi:Zn-dependent protease with chaperone function